MAVNLALGLWDALGCLGTVGHPTGDFSCHSWDPGKAGKVKRPRLAVVWSTVNGAPRDLPAIHGDGIDHLRNIQWLGNLRNIQWLGNLRNIQWLDIQIFWRIFVDTVLFRAYFCQSIFPQGLLSNWKGGSKLHK